jgi:hypothetical protein
LKLAGAAAALGAGLGMVMKARDALAADPVVAGPIAPVAARAFTTKLIIGPEIQQKITPYEKLPLQAGYVQFKFYSGAGQFLYASNVPEEIARLMTTAAGGQLQHKFYKGTAAAPTLASEPFAEGLIQLVPSTGKR